MVQTRVQVQREQEQEAKAKRESSSDQPAVKSPEAVVSEFESLQAAEEASVDESEEVELGV